MRAVTPFVLGTVFLAASAAALGQVTVPNTFSPGTPAKAADVNANFKAVVTGVNANAKAITALQTQVKNIPAGPPGPLGPQGPMGATGPMGGLTVVDSNGTVVGPYVYSTFTQEAVAVKTANGTLVFSLVPISTSATGQSLLVFTGTPGNGGILFYTSTNCTGTPYVNSHQLSSLFLLGISDGTNYWSAGNGNVPATTVTMNSVLYPPLTYSQSVITFTCQPTGAPDPLLAYPLSNGTPLNTLGFTPPFTVTSN